MPSTAETDHDVGVAALAGGIVQDARDLLVQQLTLFQVEIKNHVRQTLKAFIPLGIGVGIALTALFLLGAAGAHFVSWQWPTVPLWAGFTIAGAIVAAASAALIVWSLALLDRVSVTPDVALKGLKENLQWETKK